MADETRMADETSRSSQPGASDRADKIRSGILQNIGFIIVGLVAVIYVARCMFDITTTGKTLVEIIADGAIILLFGWFVKGLLGQQGIISGLNSNKFQQTQLRLAEQVKNIEPYAEKLNDFCAMKNAQLRISKRSAILGRKNLRYDAIFTDDTTQLNRIIQERMEMLTNRYKVTQQSKWQLFTERVAKERERREIIRCVRGANKVRIVELSFNTLTSDGGRAEEPYDFGLTISKYSARSVMSKIVSGIAFALFFGYLSAETVQSFSLGSLLWSIFQMLAFVIAGAWSFTTSYLYIVDTYRKGIVRRINLLAEFEAIVKSNTAIKIPEEIIKTKLQNVGDGYVENEED